MAEPVSRRPSREQIRELCGAAFSLDRALNVSWGLTSKDEEEYLPHFGRLADAIRPIRSVLDRPEGWPHLVGRALRVMVKVFDMITLAWGWERFAEPEPGRSVEAERCRQRFREEMRRPVVEAAFAYQAGLTDELSHDDFAGYGNPDHWAEEAAEFGITQPSMSPDEGRDRYKQTILRWARTPCFGECRPSMAVIGENHEIGLRLDYNKAINILDAEWAKLDAEDSANRAAVDKRPPPKPVPAAATAPEIQARAKDIRSTVGPLIELLERYQHELARPPECKGWIRLEKPDGLLWNAYQKFLSVAKVEFNGPPAHLVTLADGKASDIVNAVHPELLGSQRYPGGWGQALLAYIDDLRQILKDVNAPPKNPDVERNRYCYEEGHKGTAWDQVAREASKHPDWSEIGTGAAARNAALAHLKDNPGLPPLPERKPGRPKKPKPSSV